MGTTSLVTFSARSFTTCSVATSLIPDIGDLCPLSGFFFLISLARGLPASISWCAWGSLFCGVVGICSLPAMRHRLGVLIADGCHFPLAEKWLHGHVPGQGPCPFPSQSQARRPGALALAGSPHPRLSSPEATDPPGLGL